MNKTTKRGNMLKKTLIAGTTAAALGLGIISTGFISPVMADALGQIPMIGSLFHNNVDNGLKSAAENGLITKLDISDVHEGVTLRVSEVYHDGSSLSIALEREGVTTTEDRLIGPSENREKGLLVTEELIVLVNGEQVLPSSIMPLIKSDHTVQKNAALLELSTDNDALPLPDQFELTLQVKLAGIDDIYEFQVPVSKAVAQ
ncbi:DUF4179 domain-containing protein [Paenibacillus sp. 11B]|uniref:DUF4179 domain-containing protein n=1 Tax=unclassified Paenibacillus TaxID=185978 RepID=UPI002651B00B|nr:DUF4179 domain-containing protein [Paenibacillus sp. 11B]MDN8591588.1 DUF4179 domain-containing protein [Paenibacillus sp. 11B]